MKPIFSCFLCLFLFACGGGKADLETTQDTPDAEPAPQTMTDEEIVATAEENPYLISNGTFLGMAPGDDLTAFADGLRAGVLQTGEGDFDVFYLDGAEGNELGYLMPDPRDEATIGNIYVTSPDVVTEQGVRVGMSLAELEQRLGELEVHGSEIEGYTYAEKDGLAYRLDANIYTYEVDRAALKPETQVLEIVVDRK